MTWPTQQGTYDAGDVTLQSGARLTRRGCPGRRTDAVAGARQRHRLSDQLWRAASGPGVADRPGRRARPDAVVHRHPGHVRQRAVVLAVQHAGLSDAGHRATTTSRRSGGRCAELFGIDHVACVYGWSMGALQAYHWAALFPDAVERIVVNCGVARTAVHNQVFLRSLMATLEAAPQHIGNGRFSAEPRAAKRAFGRIYAAWALSQDFYRAGLHLPRARRRTWGRPIWKPSLKPIGRTVSAPAGRQPLCSASHLGRVRHQRQRPV